MRLNLLPHRLFQSFLMHFLKIDHFYKNNPNNPQIHFSDSEGKYSQTQLLSLMTFGSTKFNPQNDLSNIENIFSNYFENQIERNITQMTPLDEFQLSSSRSLLTNNEDVDIKLIVGKRISKKIYLNSQIDFYDFNDNQLEAEYRLSRNTALIGGINANEGNNSFHIKYRIKYYY